MDGEEASTTLDGFLTSIKIFFRELWKSSKILLTYGEIREDSGGDQVIPVLPGNENRHLIERAKFNGMMTSLEMFVFLMTFIIILFIAPLVAKDNIQIWTKIALILLMSMGFIIMIIFAKFHHKILLNHRKKSLGLRGQLVLIGITIFFVLGSFLDLFNIVFLLRCFPIYCRCDLQTFFDNLVALMFHSLRVIYLGAQTAFCTTYRGFRFKDRCLTRYGLMVLHVSNLAVWFDVLLRQTCAKLKLHIQPSYYNSCARSQDSNNSSHFLGCVFMNGTYNGVIKNYGNDVIYPFLFQFSLLVIECYVHWFLRCGRENSGQEGEYERMKTSSYCNVEEDPHRAPDVSSGNYPNLVRKYFILITFMNILFVLLNFLPMAVEPDQKSQFTHVTSIYCTVYWSLNVLLTLLGYYCTTAFKENPRKKKFKGLNYLLIISAIGPYIYVVTALQAVSLTGKELSEPKLLTVLKEISFFLSIFSQIPFCFLAGRVVLPSKNHENSFRVNCFKAITLHLAVSNCVLWIVDSFLGAFNTYEDSALQTKYYRTASWLFLDNIVQPLSVFFRFNSFLLFTAAHIRITPWLSSKTFHVE